MQGFCTCEFNETIISNGQGEQKIFSKTNANIYGVLKK